MKRRNKFSLSHFKMMTGKMGYLYPIACVETLPGDTFQMATSIMLRFGPLVAPVMTPVVVRVHHFYVPVRLLWDDSEDFFTGGPQGISVPVPPFAQFPPGTTLMTGALPYLGLPRGTYASKFKFSTLPLRAYRLIYDEWYRDQNLQEPLEHQTQSGADDWSSGYDDLFRSAWEKDYFTTATPWEQKGVAVSVPVTGTPAGSISITGAPSFTGLNSGPNGVPLYTKNNTLQYYGDGDETPSGTIGLASGSLSASFTGEASLGGVNLNDWREAMAMQRFEEHRALYGSRYTEYLRYLGVRASDARLQRPEYLGGGRSVVQFSEVLQTAEGENPVGTMRGHGIGAVRTNRFRRFFEEHGFVITLMSIRPKSIYMQGTPKMFSRWIKTDYWQKELEHIGQQEVLNREVYSLGDDPDGVFGYSDRYDEYRSHPSYVTGEFTDILNYWHLARDFSEQPVLNGDFINSLPSDRIFADRTGSDTIYMMVNNSIQARRLVSKHGNPR